MRNITTNIVVHTAVSILLAMATEAAAQLHDYDSGRFLAPSNLTFQEASGGFHPLIKCDENSKREVSFHYRHFCGFMVGGTPPSVFDEYSDRFKRDPDISGILIPCPASQSDCHGIENVTEKGIESCLEICFDIAPLDGKCDAVDSCGHGTGLFCDFRYEEGGSGGGSCKSCPDSLEECASITSSELGIESCLTCDLKCSDYVWGELNVDGQNHMVWAAFGPNAAITSVSGPLVDCTELAYDGVEFCPNATGAVCLVDDVTIEANHESLGKWCAESGGVALIFFIDNKKPIPLGPMFLSASVGIPFVKVAYEEGAILKKEKIGTVANVTTTDTGYNRCSANQYCTTTIPCMGDSGYCQFLEDNIVGDRCSGCPSDPTKCFFSRNGTPLTQKSVESCAKNCAADVQFGNNCKMCADPLTADFEFGVDDPADKCYFCPEQDLLYKDRVVPVFSTEETDVKCWQVQGFFNRLDVHKDSKNCKLLQAYNYICGCQGVGYAGASTEAKQKALVWGPRVTAILSLLGSLYVMYDCLSGNEWRSNVFYQLMIQLSFFDAIGSIAYMLTSLPIPSEYYYYGSKGNDATCTTQGFFIQVGTISCFTNVSLAIYYFLVIKKGLTDTGVQKIKWYLLLCPIIVGMAFAFAGIPFYGDMKLWCNNSARWWPDISVAIAIAVTSWIMGVVCWDVYKTERDSKKWRGPGATNRLSTKVFWQSFWFLMSFYMTWPPYLALQYSWSLGRSFTNYNFILYAGLVVPMQGFWNSFVYARNRGLRTASKSIRESLSNFTSSGFLKSLGLSLTLDKNSTRKSSSIPSTTQASTVGLNSTAVKVSECADEEHPENLGRALNELDRAGKDLPEEVPLKKLDPAED